MPTKEGIILYKSKTGELKEVLIGELCMELCDPEDFKNSDLQSLFIRSSAELTCELAISKMTYAHLFYADKMQKNNWRKMHGIPKRRSYKK